jgi:hypothetical protein
MANGSVTGGRCARRLRVRKGSGGSRAGGTSAGSRRPGLVVEAAGVVCSREEEDEVVGRLKDNFLSGREIGAPPCNACVESR